MEKTKQDREAVKVLAIAVGVREAARRLSLNEDTVCTWARRGKWFTPVAQPPSQAIDLKALKATPSAALATVLEADSNATKIGFSKAARKVAEHLSEQAAEKLHSPKAALSAKAWHAVAEGTHGWRSEAGKAEGVLGGLQVYSAQTVINVNQDQAKDS